jgi:hypothetical protein
VTFDSLRTVEGKWKHLDFSHDGNRENAKAFYNWFAILILGSRWTGTS